MDTPICDFVRAYTDRSGLRLHMPGHKGIARLGMEAMDITEIHGADSLYEADGIIRRSERNAGTLFGCPTFYSTEGSSQCIRAMLYLVALHAKGKPVIAAARNVHKSFLSAAALLDLDVRWLYPEEHGSYLSCRLDEEELDRFLTAQEPAALYVTSPDYLGNMADIEALAGVCHRHGTMLLVDNAHGAYLRFLRPSRHPIDLGADLCCDSAHKTLPVLTGGAYLHISDTAPELFRQRAKDALALFGSTSPSYLILQSLDIANAYLAEGYADGLARFVTELDGLKQRLVRQGWSLGGEEPLKLTLRPKTMGYTGIQLIQLLRRQGIECEFADPDFLVMMFTPENSVYSLTRLEKALQTIPPLAPIIDPAPVFRRCERAMSIREAMFSPTATLPVEACVGKILASPCVGCPPAVPIIVCGERIDEAAVSCFRYYGVDHCTVVDDGRYGIDHICHRVGAMSSNKGVRC